MCWRARRTTRPGACQSCHRNVFGSAMASGPSKQHELEPADEVGGERDDGEPGPVGVEINEREPVQTRALSIGGCDPRRARGRACARRA